MFNKLKENISKMKREVADNDKHGVCAGAGAQWHSTCWVGSLGFNLKTEKKSDKKKTLQKSNPTTINKYLKLKLLNWIDNKLDDAKEKVCGIEHIAMQTTQQEA